MRNVHYFKNHIPERENLIVQRCKSSPKLTWTINSNLISILIFFFFLLQLGKLIIKLGSCLTLHTRLQI